MLDERTELPVETPYGRSKQEGERLLRECSIEDVVIRPSHVYGPGGWFVEEFVDRLRQPGRFAVIGSGENWWDVVRAEDVASGLRSGRRAGARRRALPRRRRRADPLLRLRRPDRRRRSAPGRRAASLRGSRVSPPAPTRSAPSVRSAKSSNARIKAELGWEPRWPTAELGVPDAVAALGRRDS